MKKTIIFLVGISLFLVACSSGGTYDTLAECLTNKDAVMYGTEWCSHCKDQKKAFGDSFRKINFVDCDRNPDACNDAGVEGYPTWKINGENYGGAQPLDRLASLAGCQI